MQIEKALGEDGNGDDAAGQNRPHEQSALLDVINHGGYLLSSFSRAGQAAPTSAPERVTRFQKQPAENLPVPSFELGSLNGRPAGQSRQLIYIDGWHGRWLKVGKSGLEWNVSPPANGHARPTLLRRRVSSLHRRKKPNHHSRALATR